MQINVTGTKDKPIKKLLTDAAKFYADILLDPRMARNITLDIEVNASLDAQGECVDEDGTKNPRWFTIGIKPQADIDEMLKTLAHEMVHLKQHAKNELQSGMVIPTRGGGVKHTSKWMGVVWKPARKEDPYFDAPWEVEAYGKEVGLFQRFYNHMNG
jgi:hypothetical protein